MCDSRSGPVVLDCVLREIRPGDFQYVPKSEESVLVPGETVYHGTFRTQVENHGPYGSHRRTICLPVGSLTRS